MPSSLKEQILKTNFANSIRLDIVDEEEFDQLCSLLNLLEKTWQGQDTIDKQLAGELYVTVMITLGAAMRLRTRNSPYAARAEEMAAQLDALVLNCLTDNSS